MSKMARRARVTLEIIIEAAAEIADTNGLNEVTLAALADKLNIASPSLYNHINRLQQLRKELAIYSMEKLYNDLVYSTAGQAGDDAVRALGKAYITFVRNHPGLYDSTFLSSDANDIEVQKAARKVVELSIRILSAYGLEE
ncbi:MAG: TetR-like C-terminal domain-containing protein [Clostridium sp.]|nr:TetR-like C-terminal domain-containing protein [Clostridium sp.]MDR3595930.1 TetR-like C-terminal domain-containing protein [Clostridium sp.]